jgi:hypothetical protein
MLFDLTKPLWTAVLMLDEIQEMPLKICIALERNTDYIIKQRC